MPFFKHNSTNKIPRSRRLEQTTYKNGLRHAIVAPTGFIYIGEWKNDNKEGKGKLRSKVYKSLYEGDFVSNVRDGFGELALERPKYKITSAAIKSDPKDVRDVRIYRGDFKDGHMHGEGLRIFKDGSYYVGNFKCGKRHGYGEMWYADGSWYAGDWVEGLKQGVGILVYKNGNRYEGSFYKGKKNGKGKFFFLDHGQIQEGVWRENICIFSTMRNILFRQTALFPTEYPLQQLCLVNPKEVCDDREQRILDNQISCLVLQEEGQQQSSISIRHAVSIQ